MAVAGFTGTRSSMTNAQRKRFEGLIRHSGVSVLHHGCCVGADQDAHDSCMFFGVDVIAHPPTDQSKAFIPKPHATKPGRVLKVNDPLPYLDRNKRIVEEAEFLIATPGEFNEWRRSGTWATVRHARRCGVPVTVIFPDGKVVLQ